MKYSKILDMCYTYIKKYHYSSMFLITENAFYHFGLNTALWPPSKVKVIFSCVPLCPRPALTIMLVLNLCNNAPVREVITLH